MRVVAGILLGVGLLCASVAAQHTHTLAPTGLPPRDAFLLRDSPALPEAEWLNQGLVGGHGQWSLYSGNVVLDVNGEATCALPAYFKHLHPDTRLVTYHLTPYDQPLQLYVVGRVAENQFRIRAREGISAQGVMVGWLVIAERSDTLSRAYNRPALSAKSQPGTYSDTAFYQYLDFLDFTPARLAALYQALQVIAAKHGWTTSFRDACIVGSFAQGIARGPENPDPSDLDIAFVLDTATALPPRAQHELNVVFQRAYTDTLRQILGYPWLTFDFSFQQPANFPSDNPAQVHASLAKQLLYGRTAEQRLNVKLVKVEGRMYRFDRSRYTVLWQQAVLQSCDAVLLPTGQAAFVHRGTGEIVLQALPPQAEVIVTPF